MAAAYSSRKDDTAQVRETAFLSVVEHQFFMAAPQQQLHAAGCPANTSWSLIHLWDHSHMSHCTPSETPALT